MKEIADLLERGAAFERFPHHSTGGVERHNGLAFELHQHELVFELLVVERVGAAIDRGHEKPMPVDGRDDSELAPGDEACSPISRKDPKYTARGASAYLAYRMPKAR